MILFEMLFWGVFIWVLVELPKELFGDTDE